MGVSDRAAQPGGNERASEDASAQEPVIGHHSPAVAAMHEAFEALDHATGFVVYAVRQMELIQGVRNKAELAVLRRSWRCRGASLQPLDQGAFARAIFLIWEGVGQAVLACDIRRCRSAGLQQA